MLDLKNNRVDFGETLSPPDGFETDFAVGTTYSLDFPVLASACMSLGLSVGMDSSIKDSPLFLFHVLEKMKDRVLLFCQKGQIHCRGEQNELWILLENVIHQVALPLWKNQWPAFHPKFWLIRFRQKNGSTCRYRLVVSSRNCAQSGDWDVIASLDSKPGNGSEKNVGIRDFVRFLSEQAGSDKRAASAVNRLEALADEMSSIVFDTDSSAFDDYEFLPSGISSGTHAYDLSKESPFKTGGDPNTTETFDRLLVISPFLSQTGGEPIRQFNAAARSRQLNGVSGTDEDPPCILLTRAEELYKMAPEDCDSFAVWIARQEIVGAGEMDDEAAEVAGEAAIGLMKAGAADSVAGPEAVGAASTATSAEETGEPDAIVQVDIHAKLYMREKNRNRNLYIGSLNASSKALHRNVEVLLRLHMRGYRNPSYYDVVLKELFYRDDTPFKRVSVEDYREEPNEPQGATARDKLSFIVREIKSIKAEVVPQDDAYCLSLEVNISTTSTDKLAALDGTVRISPLLLSHGMARQLQPTERKQTLVFDRLEKTSLSEFVRISYAPRDQKDGRAGEAYTVLKFDSIKGLPQREGALLGKLISKNREEFLALAEFILSDNPEKTLLETRLAQSSAIGSRAVSQFGNSLYESMLKTADSDPEKLKDMQRTLRLMTADELGELPRGLMELVDAFFKAVK